VILALPLYDDNPVRRPPVVTCALIGLCVGAFLWQLGQDDERVAYTYGMIPAAVFGYAHRAPSLDVIPAWMTIFTSMFLHGGWWHIAGNMLFLWIFGNNVEDVLGRGRFLLLYLACGAAAAMAQALPNPASTLPMVGASGAIAGILGAYLLLYPWANVHVFVWIVIFFRLITVPAWIVLGLWFAMQLLSGVTTPAGAPGVAFWAHVGGFISGLGLVTLLRPRHVDLWQSPRSDAFVSQSLGSYARRDRFGGGGSVPPTGDRYRPPPRGPWG
jgi:membrane associated rhomboid family serine protease